MTRHDPTTLALRTVMSGGTLDHALAREVMSTVVDGAMDPTRFGALFAALHLRGESVAELTAFVEVMRERAVAVRASDDAVDTCGTGGDSSGTFNVSTCAAFVVAGAGVPVAKHGNRSVSSACGSADVLEQLGGTLSRTAAHAEAALRSTGFTFLFAPSFHPSMRHAVEPRRALGVRTAFNLLGPLANPAGVRRQVVGVSDLRAAERMARVLLGLGVERALVVHGADGLDEISIATSTTVHDVRDGSISTYDVHPDDVGLSPAPVAALRGGDARENGRIVRAVLEGVRGPARDVVLANAAAGLLVADRATDLRDGVEIAARSIDDGAALAVLERWIGVGTDAEGVA